MHCVVKYVKDVFAEVATAFDKKCTIARLPRISEFGQIGNKLNSKFELK